MFNKSKTEVISIPLEMIRPNPYQPRKSFSDNTIEELACSIKSYGVLQPIIVRKTFGSDYELIAGERRWRAAKIAGLKDIPAMVREGRDNESAVMALIENLQRENLSFMEEAEGYNQLITEHNFTQEELAEKTGKSQSTIANKLRLLRLPTEIKRIISRENLSERHARCLLKIPDENLQLKVIMETVQKGLTVRQTEQMVDKIISSKLNSDNDFKQKARNIKRAYKDIRLFMNSVKQMVQSIKESGLHADYKTEDKGDTYQVIITINKNV
jgi:ParB family chromosome partitioning protein